LNSVQDSKAATMIALLRENGCCLLAQREILLLPRMGSLNGATTSTFPSLTVDEGIEAMQMVSPVSYSTPPPG
jgi:hypothetical protein